MNKLVISHVDRATSQKLIRQYLRNYFQHACEYSAGDHIVMESEIQEYVKAVYFWLKVFGPCQAIVNEFLKNRMIVEHFFVPTINSLVVEELVPHQLRLFEIVVHRISFDTGTTSQVELAGARVKGVRTNTTELIVLQEDQSESEWEWSLLGASAIS